MKLSVSLPDEDIAFLDAYANAQGIGSRSAALQKAVRLLRASELSDDYQAAWDAWNSSDEQELWGTTLADGISS